MEVASPPTASQATSPVSSTAETFDAEICRRFTELGEQLLAQHPELRSFAVVLDYQGSLNDAQVMKGVWRGRQGLVKGLDELYGSLVQTQRLAAVQHQRLLQYVQLLKDEAKSTIEDLEKAAKAAS